MTGDRVVSSGYRAGLFTPLTPQDSTTGPPTVRVMWTDHEGTSHERQPGTIATTRCGLAMGASNTPRARPCRVCIEAALAEDAHAHQAPRYVHAC